MQNFIKSSTLKACFLMLGMTLMSQAAFCLDDSNVAYLDGVSSSYLYDQQSGDEGGAVEATFKLDAKKPITKSTKKVNLSLRSSDIKQVLRMLADKAGVNIVFDEGVSGQVTLDLKDININDAFMIILESKNLAYVVDANTVSIMTQDNYKRFANPRQNMTVLPVKYVSADKVAQFLNTNLFKSGISGLTNREIVTANPATNQLVIFGSSNDVMAIKRILPIIDVKPLMHSYKVNHTTPKEMANLICDSLFFESGEKKSLVSEENEDSEEEDMVLGGGVIACRDKTASPSSSEDLISFRANPLTVTYFNELGQIGVYGGSVEQANMIEGFIKEHDKKQLMAYIELSVIELNESGSKEFSNEWNLWTPFISIGFNPSDGLNTNSIQPFFIWGDEYPITTFSKTYDDKDRETGTQTQTTTIHKSNNSALTYKLRYLIDNGNGRILTNPKIMVTNGRKAKIDMTSDYVKSVTTQILETSTSITSGTQRTYDIGSDEGLMIEITPFISPDGYISMNITPEFATIKQQVYNTNSYGQQELGATLLQRRDIDLRNIRIKDGETLVLAGLIREKEQQTVKKMPILSDLPLVGSLFRASTNSKTREELVIVVTPHIVKDGNSAEINTQNL